MTIDDMYQALFAVAHETGLDFEVLGFPGATLVTLRCSNKLSLTVPFLTEEEFTKSLKQFVITPLGA